MAFLGFLGILIPIMGVGGFLLFVIALMNEKGQSKGETIRSAFSHVVAVVLLGLVVSSTVFLLQQGLKEWVFTKADSSTVYRSQPPMIFLAADKVNGSPATYSCTDSCQFTATDKEQLASWRDAYTSWKADGGVDSYTANSRKQDLAGAISFLVVALPLFIWFFWFMMQREWKVRQSQGQKPGPLRSTYFYFVAFVGLIGLVVSGAMLINVGVRTILGVENTTSVGGTVVAPINYDVQGVRSIVNCTSACGFSVEDKQLAEQWLVDYEQWQKGETRNTTQADLANLIPIVLVTAPLFFLHFIAIRRESKDDHSAPPTSAPAASV